MLNITKLFRMNSADVKKELKISKNVLRATYDFAVNGGAIGDIALLDVDGNAAIIPDNAVITKVLVDVITAATSGGAATVALKSEAAADLLAATAVASVTGFLDGKPVNTAATVVKLSADRTIKATVAAFALTAGKFHVFIEYVLST